MSESSPLRGGMRPKHGVGILPAMETGRAVMRCGRMQGYIDMKKMKLGSAILSSLLFVQGLLGIAAVAAVLMKEPAGKERGFVAQSATAEGLVTVR
jgi:hypothetical protein